MNRIWCIHDNPEKVEWNGKEPNRLSFCFKCNEPIIMNMRDLVAYCRRPRVIRNGKIANKHRAKDELIYWLLESNQVMIINNVWEGAVYIPPEIEEKVEGEETLEDRLDYDNSPQKTEDEETEEVFQYKETDEGNHGTYLSKTGRTLVKMFESVKKGGYGKIAKGFGVPRSNANMSMRKIVDDLAWRGRTWDLWDKMCEEFLEIHRKIGKLIKKTPVDVLTFFARANWELSKKDLCAIYSYMLTQEGMTFKDAANMVKVDWRLIKKWGERIEEIRKLAKSYPNIVGLPNVNFPDMIPFMRHWLI